MRIDLAPPFVLLDDAGGDGRRPARLFSAPTEIVSASARGEVAAALDRMARLGADGLHLAGYMAYEAGHALEPRLAAIPERRAGLPLLWFGAFETAETVDPDDVLAAVGGRPLEVERPRPSIDEAAYFAALARVKALIEAGDIYQANLTFAADVAFAGHPLALYARLRRTQRMEYGAVVWTGRDWILSASPELFFSVEAGTLTAKPMKGTAARQPLPADDDEAARALASDPKNRAENLMITDLLRNDLSRVAVAGSVTVSDAFVVERYPTVHQMTTAVHARLRPELGPMDVLRALFPCGSVTGAPKIRAIEIIDEIELRARGVYTGSIGWISPAGDARFNVAIRTIEVPAGGTPAMGVGSGIVADSDALAEWKECNEKMAFVTESGRPFHLIETMAFTPDDGIRLLAGHIERLTRSAAHHGFRVDRHEIRNLLQAVVGALKAPARVKLTLAIDGAVAVACEPMPTLAAEPVAVRVVPLPVDAGDKRLYHKTSDRAFYDDARRAAGTFEIVFERPDGALTEGSFTNLFVDRDGILLTPPVTDGLLGGVLRQSLIDSGRAREQRLHRSDLDQGFLLGNSVRGLFAARLVDAG